MLHRSLLWVPCLMLFACENGAVIQKGSQDIIGGLPVTSADYPTVGGVRAVIGGKGALCTGTLITPTVVLTAAHCVDPDLLAQATGGSASDIKYFFTMSDNALDQTQYMNVASITYHDTFPNITLDDFTSTGPKQWNDVALVFLEKGMDDSHVFQALPTQEAGGMLVSGGKTTIVGFGLTNDSDDTTAGKLHTGQTYLNGVGQYEVGTTPDTQQQACRGDSGGPLFMDNGMQQIQVGIASRLDYSMLDGLGGGGKPPPCTKGVLYTRVDAYLDWINQRLPAGQSLTVMN